METEEVVETVEEVFEDIPRMSKRQAYIVVGTTIGISVAAGATAGYFYAKKRLKAAFELRLEQEIAATKRYYGILNKDGVYSDPRNLVDPEKTAVEETATALRYKDEDNIFTDQPKDAQRPPTVIENARIQSVSLDAEVGPGGGHIVSVEETVSVFEENANQDVITEAELARRTTAAPYVLKKEEFMENETDYEQVTLTYFQGDDVLADEKESPIPDPAATVGDDALNQFGHGSGDPHIVYVRNDRIRMEFEVVHSDGFFTREVLGLDEPNTLRHSDRREMRRRRRRLDD